MWKFFLVVWVLVGQDPHRLEVTPMPDAITCAAAVEDALAHGPALLEKYSKDLTMFQAACEIWPNTDPPA